MRTVPAETINGTPGSICCSIDQGAKANTTLTTVADVLDDEKWHQLSSFMNGVCHGTHIWVFTCRLN